MKIDYFIRIVLFYLAFVFLFGFRNSIADDASLLGDGINAPHSEQGKEGLKTLIKEAEMNGVENGRWSLQFGQKPEKNGDPSTFENENQSKKPLDLTYKPDFPDNSKWKNSLNIKRNRRYQGLFEESSENEALELKGELLRSFEMEEEKYKPIDGAGIRIELKTD